MDTYDIYLKHEAGNVLPVEEAIEIYNSLDQSVALCTNEYKEEIVNELIEKSIKYSVVRAKWEVWDAGFSRICFERNKNTGKY